MSIFGRSPGQPRFDGTLHNLNVTESIFGTVLPIVIGTARVHGKLLDYNGFNVQKESPGGGKGIFGGKGQIAEYSANVAIALAQGPCASLLSVWDQQGKLANQGTTSNYVVPVGGGSISIAGVGRAPVQVDLGVTMQQPYGLTVNDYGSSGPVVLAGMQQVPLTRTAANPGAGQYTFDKQSQTYTFPASAGGSTVAISTSSMFSLFYFEDTQAVEIPIAAPYTVSTNNQAYFSDDYGVTFVDTGVALTAVGNPSASGEYSVGNGFYTFAPADASRLVYIKYSYTTSDAQLTSSSALNMTFFNGALGQPVWGFFESNYPASAFGYSGICYVGAAPMAMGEAPTLPSYNYEIMGQCVAAGGVLDAHIPDAIALLLTDPLCGINFPQTALRDWSNAKAYLAANGFLVSDTLTTQTSVADTIKPWLEAGNVAAVFSGGQLDLIPYGDTSAVANGFTYIAPTEAAATLTADDLLPFSDKKTGQSTSDDPVSIERRDAGDAWNYMQAEWTDRANDYNNHLTPHFSDAFIQKYGRRMEGPQTWHFLTTPTAVNFALDLRLKRELYKRSTYKFNLGFHFSRLNLMDLVVLPTAETVRITEIDDAADGKLAFTAEQYSYGSGNATLYPKQPSNSYQPQNSQALPGNTSAYIWESSPQAVLAQPNTLQIAVAGSQPAWGGCDVYVSSDGTAYAKVDRIESLSRVGLLSAVLAASPDPDTTETLAVDMTPSGGELVSATKTEADNFVTLAGIVNSDGTLELIAYETATLNARNRYSLDYLRRGIYGTTISSHAIGSEFAYLGTTGVFSYQYPAQYAGRTLYFKFPAFNLLKGQLQDLSVCKVYSFTVPGSTLQPPSSGTFSTAPDNPLGAYATSNTTAFITVAPFTGKLNNLAVSCLAAGTFTTPSLAPGQSFDVFYFDPAFTGGAIQPFSTQDANTYLNRVGYYHLGTVVTPNYSGDGGGSSAIWYPSAYLDTGTSTTSNPSAPYSLNPSNSAAITAFSLGNSDDGDDRGNEVAQTSRGNITYMGFPDVTPTGEAVKITFAFSCSTPAKGNYLIQVSFDSGSTFAALASGTTPVAQNTLSLAVPAGTDLTAIRVRCVCNVQAASANDENDCELDIFDIHVQ